MIVDTVNTPIFYGILWIRVGESRLKAGKKMHLDKANRPFRRGAFFYVSVARGDSRTFPSISQNRATDIVHVPFGIFLYTQLCVVIYMQPLMYVQGTCAFKHSSWFHGVFIVFCTIDTHWANLEVSLV